MIVGVIGLGLIGGSAALSLKKRGFAEKVIGVDHNEEHTRQALDLGIADEIQSLDQVIKEADLLLLAIPVTSAKHIINEILNQLPAGKVVVDMGSTKKGISDACDSHQNRNQFVASHPIAGTENSGPSAAFDGLYDHKKTIICDKEKSNEQALFTVQEMYKTLGMELVYMNAEEHDLHIAYVSHLSHISSFTLGLTVLDIEKDEKNIFNMAGSGFASTVRLAKSSPDMWAPIFEQNRDNISDALGAYIKHLQEFKSIIDSNETQLSHNMMEKANDIRRILEGIELQEVNNKTLKNE